LSPVRVQMWAGWPSPCSNVGGVSPIPAPMRAGGAPSPGHCAHESEPRGVGWVAQHGLDDLPQQCQWLPTGTLPFDGIHSVCAAPTPNVALLHSVHGCNRCIFFCVQCQSRTLHSCNRCIVATVHRCNRCNVDVACCMPCGHSTTPCLPPAACPAAWNAIMPHATLECRMQH
jgi:hypothetical protein